MELSKEVLVSLLERRFSTYQIAEELQTSQNKVARTIKKLGLKCNGYNSQIFSDRVLKTKKETKFCLVCGKKFKGNYDKCYSHRDHAKLTLDQLKNPMSRLKPILLEKSNYKCQNCGISLWNNSPVRLEIHHKDGDSKNNDMINLQVLCPNCHSQTWDYGATMNKASTRRDRRFPNQERSLIKTR